MKDHKILSKNSNYKSIFVYFQDSEEAKSFKKYMFLRWPRWKIIGFLCFALILNLTLSQNQIRTITCDKQHSSKKIMILFFVRNKKTKSKNTLSILKGNKKKWSHNISKNLTKADRLIIFPRITLHLGIFQHGFILNFKVVFFNYFLVSI